MRVFLSLMLILANLPSTYAASSADLDGYLKGQNGFSSTQGRELDTLPDGSFKQMCRDRWPHNSSMREYCEEEQRKAAKAMRNRDVDEQVGITCADRWNNDWVMYQYCVKQEINARR